MADTIGTYYFQLAPTTEGISKSISNALEGTGEQAGKSFSGGFSKVLGGAGAVIGGVTAAIGGISSALVGATNDVASYADNVDKMSQKMGISAEAYQEWEAVMQHSGTSMETLKASMKTMANAALTGNAAFQALGISEEEVAELSQEDLFARVISGLQEMEAGTERTYLSSQLLGRGATELGALLNTSAEDTQTMKDRVHELNGVLSDESVKAGAAFQDQLQDMTTASKGLVRTMTAEFLPGITEVMAGFTDIFAGDEEKGAEEITSGIQTTIAKVTKELPKILDVGSTIILAIADSVVQNLPSVVSTGMVVLEKLILGIISMLPQLVTMASTIIVEIANSLSAAAPILIPAVISAAITAVQALLDNLPLIFASILTLVEAVADSLLNDGLPLLLAALPDLIAGVVYFITDSSAQLISATALILQSIAEALPVLINTLIPVIPELVLSIIEALIDCGPQLGIAFVELLSALFTILPQIIGMIWKEIPKVGMEIINVFKSKTPDLIKTGQEGAFEFLGGFSSSKVFSRIGKVFTDIWDGFKNNFETIKKNTLTWGQNILQGLIDGIKSKISSVTDAIGDVSNKIASGFKDFFGIASPSKLFAEYGMFIDEGFAEGISDNQNIVSDAMNGLNDSIAGDIQTTASVAYDSGISTRSAATNESQLFDLLAEYLPYLAQESNVNVTLDANANGLFNLVKKANNEFKKQNGVSAFA